MNQPNVEQICLTGITVLLNPVSSFNVLDINRTVEQTYKAIHARAKEQNKILIGVTQSINTECHDGSVLYIITLVGTVVDAAEMEAQKRIQSLNPRNVLQGRG